MYGYGLGTVQISIADATALACTTGGMDCTGLLCTVGTTTTVPTTPGEVPGSGVGTGNLGPDSGLGSLLCSSTNPCNSGCCDGAGICRPGTLDNVRAGPGRG